MFYLGLFMLYSIWIPQIFCNATQVCSHAPSGLASPCHQRCCLLIVRVYLVPSQCPAQEVCNRNDSHTVVHPHVYVIQALTLSFAVARLLALTLIIIIFLLTSRLLRLPVQLPSRAAKLRSSLLVGRVREPLLPNTNET
jgi:hypothetical protein